MNVDEARLAHGYLLPPEGCECNVCRLVKKCPPAGWTKLPGRVVR